MGRASRRRAAPPARGMSDEKFREVISRAAQPVVRRPALPKFDEAAADAFVQLGMSALDQQDAAACIGSVGGGWRQLPGAAAIAAAAAGVVANRVLGAVDELLRPLAVDHGYEGAAEIPLPLLPVWAKVILAALGPQWADKKDEEAPHPPLPEDEPIEARAARSGLVIAS